MNARFVNDKGKFLHSCELPHAPFEGHHVKIHDKTYFIYRITWVLTRPFPFQGPGLEIIVRKS